MYNLLRRALFCLDAETSHELSLDCLGAAERLNLIRPWISPIADDPVELFGLQFPNRVGLAAGLDKNGDYFNALGQLGFGFVEIGTITPRPQPGNPRPRLFRLPEHQGIINRMGFNNKGVDHLVSQVKKRRYDGVLGINIGKNFDTPVERADDDYVVCLQAVYDYADYITVNISSPNTPGLRDLQFGDSLERLLSAVMKKKQQLIQASGRTVPVLVKIAPDMDAVAVAQVADLLTQSGVDGVIATNTTIGREGVESDPVSGEAGGLSGAPVREKSNAVVSEITRCLAGKLPVIGVGGIVSGENAREKVECGADLVQIYSGFVYRGPALVKECVEALRGCSAQRGS